MGEADATHLVRREERRPLIRRRPIHLVLEALDKGDSGRGGDGRGGERKARREANYRREEKIESDGGVPKESHGRNEKTRDIREVGSPH